MLARKPGGGIEMHPVLVEMLSKPVGWLTIGGGLIMLGIAVGFAVFVRRKMREEARGR